MGLTGHSYNLLMKYAKTGGKMLELGNQTIYFGNDYGKPAKPMFEAKGFQHISVDINGQDGVIKTDLSKQNDLTKHIGKFDIVTDFGTSEHVQKSYYNCWWTKHFNCKEGGYIVSENPKTGNWKGHGFWYVTEKFFKNLAQSQGYDLIDIGEHPAMNNTKDGWNVYCVLKKINDDPFMTENEFNKLGIHTQ